LRELADHEVHLWFADYDQVNAALLSRYRSLLTDAERDQESRFHFVRDRCRYVVTRTLVRTTLSMYYPLAPKDWRFSTNAFGRPEVCAATARIGGCADLRFNLSHTHSVIVLAVARGTAIGIDVESATTREISMDVAEHFFASTEVRELSRMPLLEQRRLFFEYWTLKESYIKGRGMGLSIPLDKFAFSLAVPSSIFFEVHPELADDAARWQFWQFAVGDNYVVALCAQRRAVAAPKQVRARAVLPLVGDEPLAIDVRRTSP